MQPDELSALADNKWIPGVYVASSMEDQSRIFLSPYTSEVEYKNTGSSIL